MALRKFKRKLSSITKSRKSTQSNKKPKWILQNIVLNRRLRIAQNRIKTLEEQFAELLVRNVEIHTSFQAQKLEIAAKQREYLNLQKRCYDVEVSNNAYKLKTQKVMQALGASMKEINAMFPNLVNLSSSLATNKLILTNLRSSLSGPVQDLLPRPTSEELSSANISRRNLKPARVGPMVRGMPIIKPQIILERLPQNPDPVHNVEETQHQLTPIHEDDREVQEMAALSSAPDRPNRRRLGKRSTMWRLSNKNDPLKLERKQQETERLVPAANYSSESSESESNNASLGRGLLEPVVRVRDVSRLLQNSSILKMDADQNDNGAGVLNNADLNIQGRRTARICPPSNREDPLEGSSWMFQDCNSHQSRLRDEPTLLHRRSRQRNQPSSSSDSSEEENNPQDSLYPVNNTFTVRRKSLLSNFQRRDSQRNSSCGMAEDKSPIPEPDSTINIEMNMSNVSEKAHSSPSSVSSLSRAYPNSNPLAFETSQLKKHFSSPMSHSTPTEPRNNDHSSVESSRNISLTLSTENVTTRGKRIRIPKKNLYPGESDSEPSHEKKKSKPKLSVRKSSLGRKSSIKTQDKKPTKKSANKKSVIPPRNSSISNNLSDASESSRTSRRKQNVSYKEPLLNKKMRKP